MLCALPNRPGETAGTLIVAMTADDVPVTTGNPDQGFEGYRFVGYQRLRRALAMGLVEIGQAVRDPAGSRHLPRDRPRRPPALDRAFAARRQMA